MNNDEKHIPGCRPNSVSSGESPEEGEDHLEGLIRTAREIVYQTPEVRPEKVARLKEAIEQGAYEIDSEKLADNIIEELLGKR
jgi:flagellar biosynthesis anti-sigma factor FlgM